MGAGGFVAGLAMLGVGSAVLVNTGYNMAGDGVLWWDPQFGGTPTEVLDYGSGALTAQQAVQYVLGIVLVVIGLMLVL